MSAEDPAAAAPPRRRKPPSSQPVPHPPSRRVQVTDSKKIAEILSWIENGIAEYAACWNVGLGPRTWRMWISKGRAVYERFEAGQDPTEEEAVYLELYMRTKGARSRDEGRLVQIIQQHAQVDAKHAEWLLTHNPKHRKSWSEAAYAQAQGGGPGGLGAPTTSPIVHRIEIVDLDGDDNPEDGAPIDEAPDGAH